VNVGEDEDRYRRAPHGELAATAEVRPPDRRRGDETERGSQRRRELPVTAGGAQSDRDERLAEDDDGKEREALRHVARVHGDGVVQPVEEGRQAVFPREADAPEHVALGRVEAE
jgi:hypothetical protein